MVDDEMEEGGSEGSAPNGDGSEPGILSRERQEGLYDREMVEDPEKIMFRVSASKSFIAMDIAGATTLGALLGAVTWYILRYQFFTYTFFKYGLLLKAAFFLPPAALFVWSLSRSMGKLTKRYEVSRRFIRSAMFAGVDIVETADMSKVIDCSMTRLLNVVSIRILTRDKTTPVIEMDYIDREVGEELFAFISAHSTESIVEMRAARRGRNQTISGNDFDDVR